MQSGYKVADHYNITYASKWHCVEHPANGLKTNFHKLAHGASTGGGGRSTFEKEVISEACADVDIYGKLHRREVVAQQEYARCCSTTSMAKNRQEICKNELYIFV